MNNLKKLREKRGYSQKKVATELGVTTVAISYIERGINRIANERVEAFCNILGCSAQELLGDEFSEEINYKELAPVSATSPYQLKDEYIQYSMQVIDNMDKISGLPSTERGKYLTEVYKMIHEFYENNSNEIPFETRVTNLKKEFEKDLLMREGFIDFLEKKMIKKKMIKKKMIKKKMIKKKNDKEKK